MSFAYKDGALCAEDVPLARIAAEVGTPVYVYSAGRLVANYRRFRDAFAGQGAEICYALKANSNQAVVATLAREGAGADVVSVGEMKRALAAGVPAAKIVFSGVGKTREEMAAALKAGIRQINVESAPELDALSEVAASLGATAEVAIRVNPDVDAQTHAKIATGKKENKFGVDIDHAPALYARAAALPGLRPRAIAVHIGSQLLDLSPYRAAYARVAELAVELRAQGLAIDHLDLGGGVGVPYRGEMPPSLDAYAALVRETVGHLGCRLTFEPGRAIAADAGVLVAQVVYVKEGLHRRFVIVDAAMNDLIRPTLYDAHHDIRPLAEPAPGATPMTADVVGPVCETGDTFAVQRALPPLAAGDLVAFMTAGAYGAVMASSYNTRPLTPEVLVDGDRWAVVRARPRVEDLIAQDAVPDWLRGTARGAA